MEKVTLYTIGCPRCKILEKKLNEKGIKYLSVSDEKEMVTLGIDSLPVLYVDGLKMNFGEAVKWVNNGGNK